MGVNMGTGNLGPRLVWDDTLKLQNLFQSGNMDISLSRRNCYNLISDHFFLLSCNHPCVTLLFVAILP